MALWGIAGLVAIGVAGYVTVRQLSPEHQVEARVREQVELWNDGDLAGLHATLSPSAQAACPREALETLVGRMRENVLAIPDVEIEHLRVTVDGTRATVTGEVVAGNQVVYTITASDPAVYIDAGGKWSLDSMLGALEVCSGALGTG